MNRQIGIGYNQSKGGFNSLCGYSQYDKAMATDEDDTTNLQASVKTENKQKTDDTPDNQEVVGDVLHGENGEGLNNNFTREKVSDLPTQKVGYQENTQMNIKKQVQFK